jgi:hypothetical protein
MLSERFHFLNAYMLVSISSFLLLGHSCVPVKCCYVVALTQFFTFFFFSLSLEKEASSILRSCGWYDNTYSFMSSRKSLCREARNGSSSFSESK